MKHILTIVLILGLYSCGSSQTIVDLARERESEHYKNGQYYMKDVNNYFNDFVGTWTYEYDTNKEFRITLTKVVMYHDNEDGFNYYVDGMLITYQKYENGNLIYQSPPDNPFPSGISKEQGKLWISFTDYGRDEADFGLDLTLQNQVIGSGSIQLRFKLDNAHRENPYHIANPNEPYYSVPDDMIMTKM